MSEGVSAPLGDPGSSSHDVVSGWMSGAGDVMVGDPGQEGVHNPRFHHAARNGVQFKT